MVTYETVRRLGLALPDVEEGTSYGTPALEVKGKHYLNYTWMLVRLPNVHPDAMRELLHTAHRLAVPPKRRPRTKAPRR